MLLHVVWIVVALELSEAKRRKTRPDHIETLLGRNHSRPGIEITINKTFTESTVIAGQFNVFYAVLDQSAALDLHRVNCEIRNTSVLGEDLHLLHVTASNGRGSITFSIPELTSNGTRLYEAARVIHPLEISDFVGVKKQVLSITVVSRAKVEVSFRIRATAYERSQYDVRLPLPAPSEKMLGNQHAGYVLPRSHRLNTTGLEIVRVVITSNDDLCGQLLLTKDGGNPYIRNFDHTIGNEMGLRNMEFTRRLDLILERGKVPEVLLMFVFVYADDDRCVPGAVPRTPNKLKVFNITWFAENRVSLVLPISATVLFYLLPIVCAVAYAAITDLGNLQPQITEREPIEQIEGSDQEQLPHIQYQAGYLSDVSAVEGGGFMERLFDPDVVPLIGSCDDVRSEVSGVLTPSTSSPVTVPRFKDAATNSEDSEWSWTSAQFALVLLPIMSLVFTLPSFAPSWSDNNCYHNYACSQPYWIFASFNNIFSNIGYILCSVVFLIFTKLRKKKASTNRGVHNNYGLDICMGLTLLCEAFASAIYHICPNAVTYNLDTPFIEVLCILIVLKLYGNRRHTISARSANLAAVFIILLDSFITMTARCPIVHSVVVFVVPLMVLMGARKVSGSVISNGSQNPEQRMSTPRLAFIGSAIVNILMSVASILAVQSVQPNQIVTVVCLINAALYFLYYIVMKMSALEPWCKFSRICAATALLLWTLAFYFFFKEETNWALTPAQSRVHNRPCVLLSFFDFHDLWHITSSLASLVSLLAVSTLDDAVSARPTEYITVF
ncbi:hypothetical protein Q1695_002680 [Nippostrongylus brasiliensis]|nr:hypothetical protein Q1695_002680 [Nippostrongylus brasiliensis]